MTSNLPPDYFDPGEPVAPDCPECDGTGEIVGDDDLERTCPRCQGSGCEEMPELDFDRLDDACEDPEDDELGEPVGSCDQCGVNIYEGEDDGSGLCDQCQFWVSQGRGDSGKGG